MQNINEIRKELGVLFEDSKDCIVYSISRIIEVYATRKFGRLPYVNQLTDRIFDQIDPTNIDGYEPGYNISVYNSECSEEEYREKNQNIDFEKTLEKILELYPDAILWSYKADKMESKVIFHDRFIYYDGVFYMDQPDIPDEIYNCIVEKEEKPRIRWILRNSRGGIVTKYLDINPKGSIEENYNDDFLPVNEKIHRLLETDESCIMILHGKPGTGKTSYIRDLINENQGIKFYWLDASMFAYMDSSEFIEFIASCKNGVFILEDSESILKPRETNVNSSMQSLLNISDGILGDSLKLKFICTFNTNSENIDKAVLRKGRMKVKYEFKDLKKEKVAALFRKMGLDESLATDMPLCDVYNFLEDNGNVKKKKIGFTV